MRGDLLLHIQRFVVVGGRLVGMPLGQQDVSHSIEMIGLTQRIAQSFLHEGKRTLAIFQRRRKVSLEEECLAQISQSNWFSSSLGFGLDEQIQRLLEVITCRRVVR